jgi:endonuclease/exonuclease/phosphatase family metal-dependent hydrolase
VWRVTHQAAIVDDGDDEEEVSVSVLTWNVWFDLDDWRLRFDGVADVIRRLQPTVRLQLLHARARVSHTRQCAHLCVCVCATQIVCLQEVTQQFARALKRHPWLSQHYHMLDADVHAHLSSLPLTSLVIG